jgi:hypothetical protein
MTDHFVRPYRAASSERIAELHRLCDEDFAKGQQQRALALPFTPYEFAAPAISRPAPEPADLDVAVRVAQQLLDSHNTLALREALRLLLRALDAEPVEQQEPPARRCPAAHLDDPTPCTGPAAVTVLDATNAGADGCEHHGARLLASLDGARVYALPDAPTGAAIRVFKAAQHIQPFPWADGSRTEPSQLSHEENRRRGECR